MADRKSFLIRIDERILEALKRWADDDLRSLNEQIEFFLRDSLSRNGRLKGQPERSVEDGAENRGEPGSI